MGILDTVGAKSILNVEDKLMSKQYPPVQIRLNYPPWYLRWLLWFKRKECVTLYQRPKTAIAKSWGLCTLPEALSKYPTITLDILFDEILEAIKLKRQRGEE